MPLVSISAVLLCFSGVDWRDVGAMFRAAHDYAHANGYAGGFPTFLSSGGGHVVVLLKRDGWVRFDASWRELKLADDGGKPESAEKFRAADGLCGARGYAAGFVNGHAAVINGLRHFGVVCAKPEYGRVVDVPAFQQAFFENFNFATDQEPSTKKISYSYVYPSHKRGSFFAALGQVSLQISDCIWLSDAEKAALKSVLESRIVHLYACDRVPNTRPAQTVNGAANVDHLCMNPASDEFSQSLLHELMHLAGGSHEVRGDWGGPFSCSMDGSGTPDAAAKRYFSTSPLRAECCVTGSTFAQGRSGELLVVNTPENAGFSLADVAVQASPDAPPPAAADVPAFTVDDAPMGPQVIAVAQQPSSTGAATDGNINSGDGEATGAAESTGTAPAPTTPAPGPVDTPTDGNVAEAEKPKSNAAGSAPRASLCIGGALIMAAMGAAHIIMSQA